MEASTPGKMRFHRGELGGLGMKALDVPSCVVRNALLLHSDCGHFMYRFTTHLMSTQWMCPVPISDPSPSQSPVLPYNVALVLVVTGVCCDERSQ